MREVIKIDSPLYMLLAAFVLESSFLTFSQQSRNRVIKMLESWHLDTFGDIVHWIENNFNRKDR